MSDPFDWSPRNLGPSREARAAAASARALPRRGYTYAANDGLTDRQRRQSYAAQRREYRRQQRERHRQTMAEARESDRARRRARRDAGDVTEPQADGGAWLIAGLIALALGPMLLGTERVRRARPWV